MFFFPPPRLSSGGGTGTSAVDRWGTDPSSTITPSRLDGVAIASVTNGKSGGPAAAQGTGAEQPIYDLSSVQGLPLIRFASGTSLDITPGTAIAYGLIQIDTSGLADGDVILSRGTSEGGTSKAAFELRLVEI